jgi:hypothetical protein
MGWHEGNLHNILKGKHCKGSLLRRPWCRWENGNGFISHLSFGGRGGDTSFISRNYIGASKYVSSLIELMRQKESINCLLLLSTHSLPCLCSWILPDGVLIFLLNRILNLLHSKWKWRTCE